MNGSEDGGPERRAATTTNGKLVCATLRLSAASLLGLSLAEIRLGLKCL